MTKRPACRVYLQKGKGEAMFGIKDPWVAAAFLLCLLSSLLCVIYGLIRWNRGEEPIQRDDLEWAEHEQEVEEEL
jgi:hypothetical protein